MAGSTQGSAIDDSFETLTNAPDAWISGRHAAPPPVDYQHYVEPGDTRSAVDDRCFTEHGAVERTRLISNTTKPPKMDQRRQRSRQPSTKPASHGKRRPSPSFRIRSRDGDSVVVNNPFVLRKPSRPQPREDSEQSSETDSQSQRSSTTATHYRTFQIRIRGKNGEEAIHDIKRPLHFASHRDSQATTAVGDDSDREDVKYWSANQSSSSHKRDQRYKDKSGPAAFTGFVVDSTTAASSTIGSSVNMSGALPDSSPVPTTDSARSRLLPPEKPPSSMHDSVMSISRCPSKSPSHSSSHHSQSSSHNPSRETEVIVVPDKSLEGSVTAPFTSLSTHCIVSSRPESPVPFTGLYEANDAASISDLVTSQKSSNKTTDTLSSVSSLPPSTASRISSKRVVTLTQSSRQTQEDQDTSRPVTVSLSKHTEATQEAYYNWKVPRDSLYSISTKDSRSSPYHHEQLTPEESAPLTSKNISHFDGVTQHKAVADSDISSMTRPLSRSNLSQGYQPPPRSVSPLSMSAKEFTDEWVQETAHCLPLPSSRSSSSIPEAVRSSSTSKRQSTRLASQKSVYDDQTWDKPLSAAVVSERTTSKHSRRSSFRRTAQEAAEWDEPAEWEEHKASSRLSKTSRTSSSHLSKAVASERTTSKHSGRSPTNRTAQEAAGWEQPAEWEEQPTSARHSKTSRRSSSHQKRSRKSRSSHHDAHESFEPEHDEQGSWAEIEKSSKKSTRSASPINIEEDLLDYLPPPSDDEEPLPPPLPILTTIYEETEPNPSRYASSMQTQESTRFARPGAISPHPLSSVSSAATARRPPTIEPHRLEYQRPYVESNSTSSASSGAHDSSRRHSRRSSRPRMLEEQAHHSAKEASRSHRSGERESGSAQPSRRSRNSTKVSGGGWKFW